MPNSSKTYLAFDLGAESGRAVLGRVQAGIVTIEEVHRFRNEPVEYGGSLHWDVPRLWLEMRKALSSLEHLGLEGIGLDAWGVDYALLGDRGELLQNPYHYRDRRTQGVMEETFRLVPKGDLSCHGHSIHADQYSVSTLRGPERHARRHQGGETAGDHSGSFQFLAHRKCSLRVHECNNDTAGRPCASQLGYESDRQAGVAARSASTHC